MKKNIKVYQLKSCSLFVELFVNVFFEWIAIAATESCEAASTKIIEKESLYAK